MPDSAIRQATWYQLYVRLARPTLDWAGVGGAVWALGLCDYMKMPMEDATRMIVFGFVAALHGIRTVEKMKGVA